MADKVATEVKEVKASVTEADLAKSIAQLQTLLEEDGTETPKDEEKPVVVEKAVVGTDGGLQAETPSNGDINKDIVPDEQEEDKDPLAAALKLRAEVGANITKSIDEDPDASEIDEEFAKSLAEAFSAQETLMAEARDNEFAKSLVMSTIEGFSIQHEEMNKALSGLEERQNVKMDSLIKALVPLMVAISEIKKEVSDVANAPVRTTPKATGHINKSFVADAPAGLSRVQIAERLEKLAISGKIGVQTVAQFESTGHIDPALLAEISGGSAR